MPRSMRHASKRAAVALRAGREIHLRAARFIYVHAERAGAWRPCPRQPPKMQSVHSVFNPLRVMVPHQPRLCPLQRWRWGCRLVCCVWTARALFPAAGPSKRASNSSSLDSKASGRPCPSQASSTDLLDSSFESAARSIIGDLKALPLWRGAALAFDPGSAAPVGGGREGGTY